MPTFEESATLLAALKTRLDGATARLSRAQRAMAASVAREVDAQAGVDHIQALYDEALVDVKATAKVAG